MGGGETSLLNLSLALKDQHKIFILCAMYGKLTDKFFAENIPTFVINYRCKSLLLLNMIKIRTIVRDNKIDVIHSNDPLTSVIMHYAVYGTTVKTYWTCHGQWYDFSEIKKYLIKKSNNHIFCVSTKVQESLIKMGFNNTSVSYLGIPLEKYYNAEPSHLREQLNIPKSSALIACVGRFQAIKGQLKLVKALKKIIDDGYNVHCLLVGGCVFGSKSDEEYYDSVRRYIKENHLDSSIFLLGERDDIPSVLKEIDYLVIPSDNESFGMIAIEALAAGTMVISTPNDGVSEILSYDEHFLSETNNVIGLENIIKRNLKHNYKELFTDTLFKRVEMFSIINISKKYVDIFME